MSHWSYEDYFLNGNPEEIEVVYNKLQTILVSVTPLLPSDFGILWLGNVVHVFNGDVNKISCRGTLKFVLKTSLTDLIIGIYSSSTSESEVIDHICNQFSTIRYQQII